VVVGEAPPVCLLLPGAPDSISTARSTVREALTGWGLEHLTDTATLLVSELSTNVLLHARTDFEVRVERAAGTVRVTVLDGSDREATRRHYEIDAGTGRGLGLVAGLATAWGTAAAGDPWSKAVWFELDDSGDEGAAVDGALYDEDWLTLVEDL
jgi:anti-sigma regulatory factor (Ser/Thr protein kinase)